MATTPDPKHPGRPEGELPKNYLKGTLDTNIISATNPLFNIVGEVFHDQFRYRLRRGVAVDPLVDIRGLEPGQPL
jgi:hypothetical protein